MKKKETSVSWSKLIKELQVRCQEQDVSLTELTEWIRALVERIEEREFDYYVTSGKVSRYPKQKLDVAILSDNFVYGFTVFQDSRETGVYPLSGFRQYREEISKGNISVFLFYDEVNSLYIEDEITNSAKLRKFARQILSRVWDM